MGGTISSEDRVQWVYSSENNRELEERYDEWANEYDNNIEGDLGM